MIFVDECYGKEVAAMLTSPLGNIKVYVDGACVDYKANKYSFDCHSCKDRPIDACYRIEINTHGKSDIACVVELTELIPNTGSSGENYIDAKFVKDDTILTIGMEDDNPAYESVRIKNGLQYRLIKPVDKVVFGIAWATDYGGADDVRTWFAADPTL